MKLHYYSLSSTKLPFLLALLGIVGFWSPMQAQLTLTCPPNITVAADSNCSAVVNYAAPVISNAATNDTLFAYTGGLQFYIVPAGVTQVTIEAWGGQGMSNSATSPVAGGLGGYASGMRSVNPGDTLYVYVGDGGQVSTTGGFNGGGTAGTVGCAQSLGGGGGGASDVRIGGTNLTDRIIVAGGGGGAGGNRNQGCGRGTGGGGGGGYYGGGGGAAWPSSSTVLPTGGDQASGGIGGVSSYTGATNNDGSAGALGNGGDGGNEVTSSQGGSGAALPGGVGGGSVGGDGTYSVNWTGQSGAGGSGFTGGVTSDSMASGIWTGAGQVRISYPENISLVQTAGDSSGATFPLGTTSNTWVVSQNGNSDSCSFSINVADSAAPVLSTCPSNDIAYLNAFCDAVVPDYNVALSLTDNCDPNPTLVQSPAAGTSIGGLGASMMVSLISSDASGNTDSCIFAISTADTSAPAITSCPPVQDFFPTTLDCNPVVNFNAPTFMDNCGASVTSTSTPGDTFALGSYTITYTATDSSGNSALCVFTLNVNAPVLSLITANPMSICDGETATLDASTGFGSYVWSTSDTSTSITVSTSGQYWVEVDNGTGCTGSDTIDFVVNALPNPTIAINGAQLCVPPSMTNIQWFENGVAVPGANMPCFQPTSDGSFYATVTDTNGCDGASDTLAFVGIEDAIAPMAMSVYPNPSEGGVQIEMAQSITTAGEVRVYDLTGRIMFRQSFDQLNAKFALDLGQLSAGSYIVEVSSQGFLGRERLSIID